MTQKIKATFNEAMLETCTTCRSMPEVHCTYVHPKAWSPENQRKFFNNMPLERQLTILRRAGTYMTKPHTERYEAARKKKRELMKEAQFQAAYGGGLDKLLQYEPLLTWQFNDMPRVGDKITLYSQKYIDKILAEARAEWKREHRKDLDDNYRDGYENGLEAGKKRAIDLIATGIAEGY